MINVEERNISCAVCGSICTQYHVISADRIGCIDLDLRPPPPARFTLPYQVQECPSCGYCAPDITIGDDELIFIIREGEYLDYLNNQDLPDLVRRFLMSAYVHGRREQYEAAFHDTLKASWACDDLQLAKLASACRRQAIDWMIKGKDMGSSFWTENGLYELVLATLYRRVAEFQKGMDIVETGLRIVTDPILIRALEFTKSRISRWDTLPYSFGDIHKNDSEL